MSTWDGGAASAFRRLVRTLGQFDVRPDGADLIVSEPRAGLTTRALDNKVIALEFGYDTHVGTVVRKNSHSKPYRGTSHRVALCESLS